jgi:hypothetical protein
LQPLAEARQLLPRHQLDQYQRHQFQWQLPEAVEAEVVVEEAEAVAAEVVEAEAEAEVVEEAVAVVAAVAEVL